VDSFVQSFNQLNSWLTGWLSSNKEVITYIEKLTRYEKSKFSSSKEKSKLDDSQYSFSK
jgi:hypothetical protein